MCSRDEPGRPGNIDDPIKGPIHVNSLDFYTYRWAYSPDSDLQTINDILIGCFPGTKHTATELVDDKESEEAEDSTIVVGCPHRTENPLTDIHIIAVVTKYETDVKQGISASWHISRICVPASKRGSGLLGSFFKFCIGYFSEDRPFDLFSSEKTLNSVNATKRLAIYKRYGFRIFNQHVELADGKWGKLIRTPEGYLELHSVGEPTNSILEFGEALDESVVRCTSQRSKTFTRACLMTATHAEIRAALDKPNVRGGRHKSRRRGAKKLKFTRRKNHR